jgi:E3 ubiquitin-protein ligase BRE1
MFQVDMDSFVWQERQFNLKIDLAEIPQKVSAYTVSRIADLEKDLQKLGNEKNMLVLKLEEASREPGAVITAQQHAQNNFVLSLC